VRATRKARGLTLAELGKRTGYSAAQVSRYERGITSLTDIAVLRSFASALSIPTHVFGRPVPVLYDNEAVFLRWCATEDPVHRMGAINLSGLRPLLKAEIKWGLNAHAQVKHRTTWEIGAVQRLANHCRRLGTTSLS
jgi:transcriptional regulator with XRE-family HTH domain